MSPSAKEGRAVFKGKTITEMRYSQKGTKEPTVADLSLTWATCVTNMKRGKEVWDQSSLLPSLSLSPSPSISPPLPPPAPLLGDMMKFPETKPHSPFYRLLLPLVEQSPRPLLSPVPEVQTWPWAVCADGPQERSQGGSQQAGARTRLEAAMGSQSPGRSGRPD